MPAAESVHGLQVILPLLLLFVAVLAALARKLGTPYPIIMVIGGLLLSFVPGLPRVTLDPQVIFFLILPPLLFAAAWLTSWREFSYHLVSILFLAIGLVFFTVLSVAAAAHRIIPGFDWRLGFVLGAVVAPTDAIAATAIARRLSVPRRIVEILEGESLVNDATGLLALEFGIAMIVAGTTPTVSQGAMRLGYLIIVGVVVGVLIGVVVDWLERKIDDASIEMTISLLVPYGSYLGAEAVHGSGVLAVVASGLYLSRRSAEFFSPTVRMQINAVWSALTFVLNGIVFVLIGLQLPWVLSAIRGYSLGQLFTYAALFSGLVIVLRLAWMYPGAFVSNVIRRHLLKQDERMPPARAIFVVGWTGMRGVIALAAALSLPAVIGAGRPFPHRSMIAFLTFSVILVTLVLQGLTLPPLIRRLRLSGAAAPDTEEHEARRQMLQAALEHLTSLRTEEQPEFSDVYDDLEQHYRTRLSTLLGERTDEHGSSAEHEALHDQLSHVLADVERRTAITLRNQNRIGDETLRELLYELDLAESHTHR